MSTKGPSFDTHLTVVVVVVSPPFQGFSPAPRKLYSSCKDHSSRGTTDTTNLYSRKSLWETSFIGR